MVHITRSVVWRAVLLLLMVLPAYGAQAATATNPPPDLAAMALQSSDLAMAGMYVNGEHQGVHDGFGAHHSILTERSRRAADFIADFEYDINVSDARAVRLANADLTYVLQHETPYRERFIVVLMAFDTEGAARDGLDAYVSELAQGDHLAWLDVTMDGVDEVYAWQGEAKSSWEYTYDRYGIGFRTGDIVAAIHAVPAEQDVTADLMVVLAETQRDRIQAATGTGISHYVTNLLRLRIDGPQAKIDHYWVANGEWVPLSVHLGGSGEYDRRSRVAEVGLINEYLMTQAVYGERPDAGNASGLIRFQTEIRQYDPAVGIPQPEDFLPEGDTMEILDIEFGDYQSFAAVPRVENPQRYHVMVWVDDTTIVYFQYHVIPDELHSVEFDLESAIGPVNQLVERQLACWEGTRSCERAVAIPPEFAPVG